MESMSLNIVTKAFLDHESAISSVFQQKSEILKMAHRTLESLKTRGTVYICGNGGSAADAQHFAAELVGRFKKDRKPLRAIALSTDTSVLTAVGNDYGFDQVFSRQLDGHLTENDVLFCISTSGNSPNIVNAAKCAEVIVPVLGLTGRTGGELSKHVDVQICVNSEDTAHIQEAHIFILHCLCALIEEHL